MEVDRKGNVPWLMSEKYRRALQTKEKIRHHQLCRKQVKSEHH